MALTWVGPLASTGVMTGDRRMFDEPSDLTTRTLPMPLRYSPKGGHDNAVDVGVITHVDTNSNPIMGSGFFLPEDIEPLVKPAVYKVRAGIAGPSLDLDDFSAARKVHADGRPYLAMRGRMMAATLVSTPAFADQRLTLGDAMTAGGWIFGDMDDEEAAGIWLALVAAGVNTNSWQGKPIAPRNAPFSADQAIQRIRQWAGGDAAKFSSAFLWQDPAGSPTDLSSYRLPIGDIIDGKLTVIYHAIYAGAALIQGAHGGLPGIGDADKSRLRGIVDKIYAAMGRSFDEVLEPPWDQGAKNRPLEMTDVQDFEITNVDDVATAVGTGFVAGGGPLAPASSVFDQPTLERKSPHVIIEDGRISGYIAMWDTCHVSFSNVCTTPPRSKLGYAKFHQGNVLTAEGTLVPVGKITMGGGHADAKLGLRPAVEHYDNTTTAVAAVRAYEDDYGISYAGVLMPGVTDEQVFILRASALSGDWRFDRQAQDLEMIAALAVNTPGFPIVQVASGTQVTLLAAGMAIESEGGQAPGDSDESSETIVAATEPATDSAVTGDDGNGERVARLAAILAADQSARTDKLKKFEKMGEE